MGISDFFFEHYIFALVVVITLSIICLACWMCYWEDYLEHMDDGLSTAEIFEKAGED